MYRLLHTPSPETSSHSPIKGLETRESLRRGNISRLLASALMGAAVLSIAPSLARAAGSAPWYTARIELPTGPAFRANFPATPGAIVSITRPGAGSGACLELQVDRDGNNPKVLIEPCSGDSSQQWQVTADGSIQFATEPDMCLAPLAGRPAANTVLTVAPCDGSKKQRWQFKADGTMSRMDNAKLCMAPTKANAPAGSSLTVKTCNTSKDQKWATLQKFFRLRNQAQNFCLDPAGVEGGEGDLTGLWNCDGGRDQYFALNRNGELVDETQLVCLDVADYDGSAGRRVGLYHCEGLDDQRWTAVSRESDTFELRSRKQGLCLDAPMYAGNRGDILQLAPCDSRTDQYWTWEVIEEQEGDGDRREGRRGRHHRHHGEEGMRDPNRAEVSVMQGPPGAGPGPAPGAPSVTIQSPSYTPPQVTVQPGVLTGPSVTFQGQPVHPGPGPGVITHPSPPVVVAPPPPAPVVVTPPAPPRVVVVQAPEPPRPVARDCGTSPSDQGCQESRNGRQAMERDLWLGYYNSIKDMAGDLTKQDIVDGMLKKNMVTAQQFMALLDLFNSDLIKLDLCRDHQASIVDPTRTLSYSEKFHGSLSKADFVKIMTGQN